jgi:hypothetical protein
LNRTLAGIRCCGLICLGLISPCQADVPVAALRACRSLTDAAARLACFDRETATLDTQTSSTAPAPAPVRTAAPPDPKQQFGLSEQAVEKQEIAAGMRASDPRKIEAHISQLSHSANGRAIFTLDNGQIWRQLVADAADLRVKDGDSVTISRAALGSYWLAPQSGPGCKVTRVQ